MRWLKEEDPLTPGRSEERSVGRRGGVFLSLLGALAAVLTVCSFLLWDDRMGTGDISLAVSRFEEFFSENEAIAVFLGWSGR